MLGFENESGFYVFFKRYCNITPKDYRKKLLNGKEGGESYEDDDSRADY